jgi:hypothetical protein
VVSDAVVPASRLADEINAAIEAVEWPTVHRVSGIKGALSRRVRAASAAKTVNSLAREAVRSVVVPLVAEPTVLVHQAYRNLDELTELTDGE